MNYELFHIDLTDPLDRKERKVFVTDDFEAARNRMIAEAVKLEKEGGNKILMRDKPSKKIVECNLAWAFHDSMATILIEQ